MRKDGSKETEKEYRKWLITSVIKLFRRKDPRRLGCITLTKCIEIIKELKLNVECMACPAKGHLTFEEVLDTVISTEKACSYPKMVKRFFTSKEDEKMCIGFPELFVRLLQDRGDLPANSGNALYLSDIQHLFK